jgi:hypothetical protein
VTSTDLLFLRRTALAGIALLLSTEVLSSLGQLRAIPVALTWTLTALALWRAFPFAASPNWRALKPAAFALPIALGIFLSGLLAAPNNYDSMVYHLPRVMQWASRGSLDIYPTGIPFQVTNPALAEYGILHLFLLTRSDRFFFLVQFAAWLGCLRLIWMLTRENARATAFLLAAALPMGVLQASSTQNELVAAFWLLHLFLSLKTCEGSPRLADSLFAGLSLGLLLATKGTAYLYAAPLLAVCFLRNLRNIGNLRALVITLLIGLAVNAPYFARELAAFGTPLPSAGEALFNGRHTPAALLSNLLKNGALELNGPFAWWNSAVLGALGFLHQVLGVSPGDPALTLSHSGFSLPPLFLYEDFDGNPLFTLLALALLPLLFRRGARTPLTVAALSFAALATLKWSSWHARYHLPLLLLLVPGVAEALENRVGAKGARSVAVLLCVFALPYAFENRMKPLLPLPGRPAIYELAREQQYFAASPPFFAPYRRALEPIRASGCRVVGVASKESSFEYPLWPLLGYPRRVFHELVENPTASLAKYEDRGAICARFDLRPF